MLTFRSVPVIPRFDESETVVRFAWAGVYSRILSAEQRRATIADLLAELNAMDLRRATVTAARTSNGIEVDVRRKTRSGALPRNASEARPGSP